MLSRKDLGGWIIVRAEKENRKMNCKQIRSGIHC